jgi:hypothetical protein
MSETQTENDETAQDSLAEAAGDSMRSAEVGAGVEAGEGGGGVNVAEG